MSAKLSSIFDFSISRTSWRNFRGLISLLCFYEFFIHILFFDIYFSPTSLNPYDLVANYLVSTNQDGWPHLLFFASSNTLYSVILLIFGMGLSALMFCGLYIRLSTGLLSALWLGLCYRQAFFSHGGDLIIFFALLLILIETFHRQKENSSFNKLFFLQFGLIMGFAGINKFSGSWLDGAALEHALVYDAFSSSLLHFPNSILNPISKAVPFFEIILPFLLIFRRSRKVGVYSIFAFCLVLFFLFSSGSLVFSIFAFGLAFWSTSEVPYRIQAQKRAQPLYTTFLIVFGLFAIFSSVVNMRIFDRKDNLWFSSFKVFEARYYFAQNWSYMTNPTKDLLKIKIQSDKNPQDLRTYTVKSWIRDWSESEFLDFLLIHRRALFFKHLFWNPNLLVPEVFGNAYCRKLSIQDDRLDFELWLGDSMLVKRFQYTCKM